jgi:hypothetical protein
MIDYQYFEVTYIHKKRKRRPANFVFLWNYNKYFGKILLIIKNIKKLIHFFSIVIN